MSGKIASINVLESNLKTSSNFLSLRTKNDDFPDRLSKNATGDEKTAFLASFTADEEKRIMRKVDYRLLVLMSLMLMIKNVRNILAGKQNLPLKILDRHR